MSDKRGKRHNITVKKAERLLDRLQRQLKKLTKKLKKAK